MPGYITKIGFEFIPDNQVVDVLINGVIVTATDQIQLRNDCNNAYYDVNLPYRNKVPVRPADPAKSQYKHVFCNDKTPDIQKTTSPTQMLDSKGKLIYNRHHDENWQCWGCIFAPANWPDMNKHFRNSETCPLRGTGDYSQTHIIANSTRVPRPRTG